MLRPEPPKPLLCCRPTCYIKPLWVLLFVGMQASVLCVDAVVAVLVAAGGSGNGPPQSTQCGELKPAGL
jgi:hypothetical protein